MAHDVLSSLLSFPIRAFKIMGSGWKLGGKNAGKYVGEIAQDMSKIGDTVEHGVEKLWDKGSDYMKELAKISDNARDPLTGSVLIGGKVVLDSANKAIDLAAEGVGRGLGYAMGLPLAAVAGTTRLSGRLLHYAGKEWGGYKALGTAGKGLAKGAWWMTKTGSKGLALEAGRAINGTMLAGRFIWKMRNNKTFQRTAFMALAGGGLVYGGIEGAHNANNGTMIPYDPYNDTFTNPQEIRNPQYTNVPGQRTSRKLDDFGATGDLVFAMNNLRNKGMF